jgi:hypothetical protein
MIVILPCPVNLKLAFVGWAARVSCACLGETIADAIGRLPKSLNYGGQVVGFSYSTALLSDST